MRNYQIVRLLSATALRSKNIRKLTYREDNTGHLRREGDKWVIEIPYTEFKNWQSSFFGPKKKRENYRKVLADLDGFYDHLDEYLKVHRPILLQGGSSDIVIVASSKKPLYSAGGFRENYGYLTMYYLAHNPFRGCGIPGVLPYGPHSVRDIVATHVIKQTGSYDLAGYSIQDTGRTARKHYAQSNLSRRVVRFANAVFRI
jgi:integrase